ncbi:DUF6801 domain-containing protein [Actinokineospora bangkokensis]|uniref:DUF6801 domain-containing protein n=1 Tax=Actinokineospora bangkokensis TaxID=1193682 RepID=A0A1Q9LJK1_9PSEU|nr:DUF6801 domain-containing protein [Actinokineospora bangkokensis]OLR92174.1 hypothetical protein BJP25_22855 [Actinokineospora bangkokensis]
MSRNTRLSRITAAAVGAAGVVALVAAPVAQAEPVQAAGVVTKAVTFSCAYPLIGNRDVPATVTATFPSTVAAGTPINTTDFSVAVSLDDTTVQALQLVGAATVEGTSEAGVDLSINGTELGVTLPGLDIPVTAVTGAAPIALNITGLVPSLTVKSAGQVDIAIGNAFTGKITPKTATGELTGLGTFDLNCSALAGQDLSLVSIPVT